MSNNILKPSTEGLNDVEEHAPALVSGDGYTRAYPARWRADEMDMRRFADDIAKIEFVFAPPLDAEFIWRTAELPDDPTVDIIVDPDKKGTKVNI